LKLAEDFLYVLGVIGLLAGQSRVTRHVDAPCVSHILWSIIDDAGFVVSSVVSSHLALLLFHMLAGNLDRALYLCNAQSAWGSKHHAIIIQLSRNHHASRPAAA
jgi:hypothetical protein